MAKTLLSIVFLSLMMIVTMAKDLTQDLGMPGKHNIVRGNTNINYTRILNFWKAHKRAFGLHGGHEEVVLVMGNTGSGKTTLVSALIGRKLTAKRSKGYVVIVDEEDRIGTGASSKTLIPEILSDKKSNLTYVDCSGFRDNRDIEYEISSLYFQKTILNQVKVIKFILVINYESLKDNGNKNDFDDLFEHIGEFMKDISKFHDGIALVATKVENTYERSDDGNFSLVNDDQSVLDGIADYLNNKREIYLSKTENTEKNHMFVDLIDVLLQKNNDSYSRIAIFRQPDGIGLLRSMPKTKNEIDTIERMILTNLNYVEKTKGDFGFALPKSTKATVDQIVDYIFKNALTNRLHKMGDETITHYLQTEKHYSDIGMLRERILQAYNLISKIKNFNEPKELFREFLNTAITLNISVSLTNLNHIFADIEALRFFTAVSSSNGDTHMFLLKNETQTVTDLITKTDSFYFFLINLQENLAAYSSQKLKNDRRIGNILTSCASATTNVVQDITDSENIVKEIGSNEFYGKIKSLKLNRYQLKHLKAIFSDFTSEQKTLCDRSSRQLTVKGYNVKLSDVVQIDCWAQAKTIQIFALNKVFIDNNIDKTGIEAQLSILSPTWEVVGSPKIILNGKAGEPHQRESAISADNNYVDGANGLPGLPGGNAGSFFGVGKQFINSEQLEVQANGGKGGPGQHGGNGSNGIAGEELPESFFQTEWKPEDVESYLINHGYAYSLESTGGFNLRPIAANIKYDIYVHGKAAKKPTDGGDGGAGGMGGNPGRIIINSLGKLVNITTSNDPGSTGLEGQGGHGGKETHDGRRVVFAYGYAALLVFWGTGYSNQRWSEGDKFRADNGNPGSYGNDQEVPTPMAMSTLYPAINSFKEFVRNNLFENTKESELRTVISKLEINSQVKEQYNTVAFVEELEGLENEFLKLKSKIDFVPFYDSFLSRVEEFAMSERNLEHKKILSYIYTAALTKAFTLKKKRNGKTVVDLNLYLTTIETSVKEVHDAQHLQILRSYRDDYENTVRNKIREANEFTQNKIEPEINNLWDVSDNQIKAIFDEINLNKTTTEYALTLLEKERENIRNTIHMRSLLLPLKLVVSSLSFFGIIGAETGVDVASSVSVATGMLLDKTTGQEQNQINSLDSILKLMPRVIEVFNIKPSQLADKLAEVVTKLNEHKEELSTIQKEKIGDFEIQVNEVKNRNINDISGTELREKDVKRIEKEINEFLNSRKDILENEKIQLHAMIPENENGEKLEKEIEIEKSLRRINDTQSKMNTVETVLNVIKNMKSDERMVRNINKQISEYVDQLRELEKLDSQVYDIVIPELRQIETTVNAIKGAVNGSSHAKLDLTKWSVRNTLKDVKSLLQKFTQKMSYELQSNLKRFMEKLDEGFSILINIYDRIETYSDSVEQAEYMAHIMSAPMTNFKVSDSKLSDSLVDLKLIIQSNILFEKYGIAFHAFKQHYFPFAAQVLQRFQLPTDLRLKDIETLRSNVIDQIKAMKEHIDETQAILGGYSKFTHKNNIFNNNTTGSSPFYVWNYDSFKDEVQQLLNGSEILLKADISKGLEHNSVKFNDIELNFRFKNRNVQNSFNSLLKNFALTMTLIGNNYYRCDERYYYISFDDDITISYTLDQDKAGNWINPNEVYTKIRDSHTFLSPYALWSIRLKSVEESVSFDDLALFANEAIDLELTGRGDYIEQNAEFNFNICDENLGEFYNVENIVQELA